MVESALCSVFCIELVFVQMFLNQSYIFNDFLTHDFLLILIKEGQKGFLGRESTDISSFNFALNVKNEVLILEWDGPNIIQM